VCGFGTTWAEICSDACLSMAITPACFSARSRDFSLFFLWLLIESSFRNLSCGQADNSWHDSCFWLGISVSESLVQHSRKAGNMSNLTATSGKQATVKNSASKETLAPVTTIPESNEQCMSEDEIRLNAYLKWEAAGRPDGDEVQFWLEAEKELQTA